MSGAGLEAVVAATRQLLAIVIAVLSIAGAGYLLSHKLNNPDHFSSWNYPYCVSSPTDGLDHPIITQQHSCTPPARAAWQIPLAVLLAVLGLGAVGVVGSGTGRAAARTVPRLGARPPA
jgi:hypothetical protein